MPDGRVLTNPNLIWPGLQLRLPGAEAPEPATEEIAEAKVPPEAVAPVDEIPAADETAPEPLPVDETIEATASEDELVAPPPQVERRPTVVVEIPRSSSPGLPPELIYGAAATATSAAVVGGIYLARRRFRRSLSEPPVSRAELGYENEAGFAEGDVARAFVHRVHGAEVEPVARIAGATLDLLGAEGIRDVSLISAHQGRVSIGLTLEAGMADQERIVELAPTIAARLGGGCEVRPTPDHDVLVRLTGVRPADFMALPAAQGELPLLLPIGLVQRREPLYASWSEMKNALVAGAPGVGTDAVLTSLVASLVARRHPRDLQLWTIAERGNVAPQILELPHQHRVCTDSQDTEAVSNTVAEIRQELERRIEGGGADQETVVPDLVLVIGELADLPDDSAALDVILRDGPAYGIRVLAATTRPEALAHDLTAQFSMRLVLHLDDEGHSVQLLGRPDAADLGADGDVLFRVGGRSPVLLRGFRVAPERLDQLVDLMAREYTESGFPGRMSGLSVGGGSPPSPAAAEAQTPGTSETLPATGEEASSGVLLKEGTPNLGIAPGAAPREPGDSAEAGDGEGSEHALTPNEPAEAPETTGDEGSPSRPVAVQTAEPPGLLAILEQRRTQSVIQVRCFGGLQVTHGERELKPETKDGPRHKPWEILAFLAAQPARGVPKEKLLSALWPGVGPERATSRLYSNLNLLRTVLIEQVPGLRAHAARGDKSEGMYRLDSSVVWSDVQEFLALSDGARKVASPERKLAHEQARALYIGQLLRDMPYKWVNDEDEHGYTLWESYREKYRQLTCQLAQLLSAEGEPEGAVLLYRDLLQDEPTLEDVVRQLFRCYQQLGDRGSLIRDERLLREAIRQRYADPDDPDRDPSFYEPEPETSRLYQEILAGLDARTVTGEASPRSRDAPLAQDRRS